MKINFTLATVEKAPKGFVRLRITESSFKRLSTEGEELEVGIGKKFAEVSRRNFILICRSIITTAKQNKVKKLALALDQTAFPKLSDLTATEFGSLVAEAFEMANYEHNTYKTKPKEGWGAVEEILICGETSKDVQAGFKRGQLVAQEVNACRELANTPGGDMTPKTLAQAAKKALLGTKATLKVLGVREMEKLGMGAILGIGKGSKDEPQFIVMEYWGAGKPSSPSTSSGQLRPTVLVGKGVTFDTGGLNIKTGDHMYEMHMDMSGGAAVIHAVVLAAKLKLKANVIGLVPAVENMAGAGAVRPGDILKSLSGKTIEVLNTDAEGRVILADGITYAKRYKPKAVVDVATLTGASLVAVGTVASCFMTNEEQKINDLMMVAEKSGDYMWPLPAWEEYEPMVKGTFGDIPNLSTDGSSRDGGVIAGGMFLREFAKELECLWVHIDMAPRMTARPDEYLAKGAVGAPVRFLLHFIESEVK